MPSGIKIRVPVTIARCGDLYLARAIGFPGVHIATRRPLAAVRTVLRRVAKIATRLLASELAAGLIRGTPSLCRIDVKFAAPTDACKIGWRTEITLSIDVVRWRIEPSIDVAFVPALSLRIVASPNTDFDKLIDEQVRAAMRRNDLWNLRGLSGLESVAVQRMVRGHVTVEMETPSQRAIRKDKGSKKDTPTLRKIASKVDPATLPIVFGRDDLIDRVAKCFDGPANRRRSILIVGPPGVGKTAIFHGWIKRRIAVGLEIGEKPPIIWATDGSRLISGQSGFGGWQEQTLAVVEEAHRTGAIIHFGSAAQICESGKAWGSGGIGGLLAPRLAERRISAVMECTATEFDHLAQSEPRLIAALQRIDVAEPSRSITEEILIYRAATWTPIDRSYKTKSAKSNRENQDACRHRKSLFRPSTSMRWI